MNGVHTGPGELGVAPDALRHVGQAQEGRAAGQGRRVPREDRRPFGPRDPVDRDATRLQIVG